MRAPTGIRTYSPLKTFFLTTFRGHRVRCTHREPVISLPGFVIYDTSWTLDPVEGN